MANPKVIFLDAVGTLFGVRGSVGGIYANIALDFGVNADPEALDRAFHECFDRAEPCTFPGVEPGDLPTKEYEWWKRISAQTFDRVNALNSFVNFEVFFTKLYRHFATADPWLVYPDVVRTLKYWSEQSIELGVISNFDTRLYVVLEELDLAQFFMSVTLSTEVGIAKPDPDIFTVALHKHQCQPADAWHIGDSQTDDYQGAIGAGLRGIWLKRE
jgi:putative hydrolase of the HAD superfamily